MNGCDHLESNQSKYRKLNSEPFLYHDRRIDTRHTCNDCTGREYFLITESGMEQNETP